MTTTVNFKRPYIEMNGPKGQADCIEQDGVIYWWSESNVQYEVAWWLDPIIRVSPIVEFLRAARVPDYETRREIVP